VGHPTATCIGSEESLECLGWNSLGCETQPVEECIEVVRIAVSSSGAGQENSGRVVARSIDTSCAGCRHCQCPYLCACGGRFLRLPIKSRYLRAARIKFKQFGIFAVLSPAG